jgi:hypothetical protein
MSHIKINTDLDIKKINRDSFHNTLEIIKVILLSYNGIINESAVLKTYLVKLRNKIQNTVETPVTLDIIKKEYDNIINQFYNNLSNYVNIELTLADRNVKTLFNNNNSKSRHILLTYVTKNGVTTAYADHSTSVVINNSIAIVDNVKSTVSNNLLNISISDTNISIPFPIVIPFTFLKLTDIIDQIIIMLFNLDGELQKNITVIRESILLIKTIKNKICCLYK